MTKKGFLLIVLLVLVVAAFKVFNSLERAYYISELGTDMDVNEKNVSNMNNTTNVGSGYYASDSYGNNTTALTTKGYVDTEVKASVSGDLVDITTLTPYIQQSGIYIKNGLTDIMGNTYTSCIISWADLPGKGCGFAGTDKETYWVWDIGGKYSRLTATGFIEENDKDKGSLGGSVRIYGDNRLLFEKYDITCETKPYMIDVDITGVTDLKIELYGQNSDLGWSLIWGCLGNINLQVA